MSTPLWALHLAREFWRDAGVEEPFPRRLRDALMRSSFLVTIEEIPHLSVAAVERYLARQGRPRTCDEVDRPLCGCLVAENGGAFVFVDARDEQQERTFSLAHEVAHFLRDSWQPRRRAVEALGEGVLAVLDGRREPTMAERLHALLRQAPIGCQVHLMRRERGVLPPAVRAAEEQADVLAMELLAPAAEVRAQVGTDRAGCERVLQGVFGFPATAAAAYTERLYPVPAPLPLVERLKKALAERHRTAGEAE